MRMVNCVRKRDRNSLSGVNDMHNEIKSVNYEKCVLCRKVVSIDKSTIDLRYNYIEGIGQLCRDCYHKVEEDNNLSDIRTEF